jgi:hypothetical protein
VEAGSSVEAVPRDQPPRKTAARVQCVFEAAARNRVKRSARIDQRACLLGCTTRCAFEIGFGKQRIASFVPSHEFGSTHGVRDKLAS